MLIHTYLNQVLEPIKNEIDNYNWIISDVEMNSSVITDPPIDMETDYFILSPSEFKKLVNCNVQFWWGAFLAVPISKEITLDTNNIPYVEGNELIWKNGNLQYEDAEIEIDCVDSGYTIVKFTNQELSGSFKNYFDKDAVPLAEFK